MISFDKCDDLGWDYIVLIFVFLSLLLIIFRSCRQGVLDGKYDDLPEQSFYMVGGIEEVMAKAEKISKESSS